MSPFGFHAARGVLLREKRPVRGISWQDRGGVEAAAQRSEERASANGGVSRRSVPLAGQRPVPVSFTEKENPQRKPQLRETPKDRLAGPLKPQRGGERAWRQPAAALDLDLAIRRYPGGTKPAGVRRRLTGAKQLPGGVSQMRSSCRLTTGPRSGSGAEGGHHVVDVAVDLRGDHQRTKQRRQNEIQEGHAVRDREQRISAAYPIYPSSVSFSALCTSFSSMTKVSSETTVAKLSASRSSSDMTQ